MTILPFLNGFQVAGDIAHVSAILILLLHVLKTKSCTGISGGTQALFLVTYTTRYIVDVTTVFVSSYNTFVSVLVIILTAATIFCVYVLFRDTYDGNYDTLRARYLVVLALVLALPLHYWDRWNIRSFQTEVLSAFTLYLEIVAILPQFSISFRTGEVGLTLVYYVLALFGYRVFYAFQWIYQKVHGWDDDIALASCVVQSLVYCVFFACLRVNNQNDASEVTSFETFRMKQFRVTDGGSSWKSTIQIRGGKESRVVAFFVWLCQTLRRECHCLLRARDTRIAARRDDGASEALLGSTVDLVKPAGAAEKQTSCIINMDSPGKASADSTEAEMTPSSPVGR